MGFPSILSPDWMQDTNRQLPDIQNTMTRRRLFITLAIIFATAVVLVGLTAALIPQDNPAFATALDFSRAALTGDDDSARALLGADLRDWVDANCPDASVSTCITDLIPPEWGPFQNIVFRRAAPDGDAWNVDLIATFAEDVGFTGVCIYHRMEEVAPGDWRVVAYAGYIHCGDPASRNMAANPDAPNRVP